MLKQVQHDDRIFAALPSGGGQKTLACVCVATIEAKIGRRHPSKRPQARESFTARARLRNPWCGILYRAQFDLIAFLEAEALDERLGQAHRQAVTPSPDPHRFTPALRQPDDIAEVANRKAFTLPVRAAAS